MANFMKIYFFIVTAFFFFVCQVSHARNKAYSFNKGRTKELLSLKLIIEKQNKKIDRLHQQINQIERKLGENNQFYLSLIKKRKLYINQVYSLEKKLHENEKKLKERHTKAQHVLEKYLINVLDENQNSANLLEHKLLAAILKKKIKMFAEEIAYNQVLQEKIADVKGKINDFFSKEQELTNLLNRLENKKKSMAEMYVSYMKTKGDYQKKYSKLKRKIHLGKNNFRKIKNKIKKFLRPLKEYTEMKYKNKGITFKFLGSNPLHVAQNGKVVYVGNLSTYGNVIILDHGDQTRSILLGDLLPQVKVGKEVKKGGILGRTKDLGVTYGKVYFEVRIENKIQNTIYLMDKKSNKKQYAKQI